MERIVIAALLVALVAAAAFIWRQRSVKTDYVEPGDFGLTGSGLRLVGFSSLYCWPCNEWETALAEAGVDFAPVEVSERPDLARKYRVRATPLLFLVDLPEGRVVKSYEDYPEDGQLDELLTLATPH